MYTHNIHVRSRNHCCRGKVISITYCVFVALVMQHAKRMRHITLSAVAFPAVLRFTTLSHKRHVFLKKKRLLDTKCVFRFSLQLCLKHFSF
jgi:hypothetical protein